MKNSFGAQLSKPSDCLKASFLPALFLERVTSDCDPCEDLMAMCAANEDCALCSSDCYGQLDYGSCVGHHGAKSALAFCHNVMVSFLPFSDFKLRINKNLRLYCPRVCAVPSEMSHQIRYMLDLPPRSTQCRRKDDGGFLFWIPPPTINVPQCTAFHLLPYDLFRSLGVKLLDGC